MAITGSFGRRTFDMRVASYRPWPAALFNIHQDYGNFFVWSIILNLVLSHSWPTGLGLCIFSVSLNKQKLILHILQPEVSSYYGETLRFLRDLTHAAHILQGSWNKTQIPFSGSDSTQRPNEVLAKVVCWWKAPVPYAVFPSYMFHLPGI